MEQKRMAFVYDHVADLNELNNITVPDYLKVKRRKLLMIFFNILGRQGNNIQVIRPSCNTSKLNQRKQLVGQSVLFLCSSYARQYGVSFAV